MFVGGFKAFEQDLDKSHKKVRGYEGKKRERVLTKTRLRISLLLELEVPRMKDGIRLHHTWARRGVRVNIPTPQPPDPIVVTYELYVVDPPSPQNSRGPCPTMDCTQTKGLPLLFILST